MFLCNDGLKCIPLKWKCDFSPDCLDASDEPPECPASACQPSAGHFACTLRYFKFRMEYISIETYTHNFKEIINKFLQICFKPSQKCIPRDWVCDNEVDCVSDAVSGRKDDSDEDPALCKSNVISCGPNQLICKVNYTVLQFYPIC